MRLEEIKKILGETKKVIFHYNFETKLKCPKPFILKELRAFFILFCCKSQVKKKKTKAPKSPL
jgi:hypothetical protein